MNSIVLGASTGTGAAITRALVGKENQVLGFHRGRHMPEVSQVIADTMARAVLGNYDVGSSYECVQKGLDVVHDAFGAENVNVFVHSLAGASVGSMLGQSAASVEKTFAVMAHSFLWWAQGLHERKLLAERATLIGLSNPVVHHYLYSTGVIGPAKAALESYIKNLAVELGRHDHRVFGIRFGAVETPALDKIVGASGRLKALHQYISPYKQMMLCYEVGAFVRLLTENAAQSRALNGAIVDFDMGSTLTLLDYAFGAR